MIAVGCWGHRSESFASVLLRVASVLARVSAWALGWGRAYDDMPKPCNADEFDGQAL